MKVLLLHPSCLRYAEIYLRLLAQGQGNFFRMLWKFNSVYNPARQLADHQRQVRYEIGLPEASARPVDRKLLYVHQPSQPHGIDSRHLAPALEADFAAGR
jgi:hopanoid C-3 methylase